MKDELVDERLRRYEALLREKGIDPNEATGTSEAEYHPTSNRSEVPGIVWQLPTRTSTVLKPQATSFEPQLLHGQEGTKLVDK